MKTVWTSCRSGEYRESVDLESEDGELRVLQEEVISHTDAATRVCHLGGHGPGN